MKTLATCAALAAAGFLAACQSPGYRADPYPQVTGTVDYFERIALPRDAVLEVELFDTSDPRYPRSIGVHRDFEIRQLPVPFAIDFNRGQIDPYGRYEVAAEIWVDEELWFTNTEPYYVLTEGYPMHDLDVVVRPVR